MPARQHIHRDCEQIAKRKKLDFARLFSMGQVCGLITCLIGFFLVRYRAVPVWFCVTISLNPASEELFLLPDYLSGCLFIVEIMFRISTSVLLQNKETTRSLPVCLLNVSGNIEKNLENNRSHSSWKLLRVWCRGNLWVSCLKAKAHNILPDCLLGPLGKFTNNKNNIMTDRI